jgi:hypothetical protein
MSNIIVKTVKNGKIEIFFNDDLWRAIKQFVFTHPKCVRCMTLYMNAMCARDPVHLRIFHSKIIGTNRNPTEEEKTAHIEKMLLCAPPIPEVNPGVLPIVAIKVNRLSKNSLLYSCEEHYDLNTPEKRKAAERSVYVRVEQTVKQQIVKTTKGSMPGLKRYIERLSNNDLLRISKLISIRDIVKHLNYIS